MPRSAMKILLPSVFVCLDGQSANLIETFYIALDLTSVSVASKRLLASSRAEWAKIGDSRLQPP